MSIPNLSLHLEVDKDILHEGDAATLSCVVKNTGVRAMYFLPWGGETGNWLDVYSINGERVEKHGAFAELIRGVPLKSDFSLIKPGEAYRRSFVGKIYHGKLGLTSRNPTYDGWYIQFDEATFLLPSPGDYSFKAHYGFFPKWQEVALKLFGQSAWCDNLESNEVIFRILA